MSKPVFVNGKAYLDKCYICNQYKTDVRASQLKKDPLYCATLDYWGEVAIDNLDGNHVFTLYEKKYNNDIKAEREWFESNGEVYHG